MLIGAGSAGRMILRDLQNTKEVHDRVCCIIDDDKSKQGCFIDGEIKHSVIFGGVELGEGSVVSDSVIMPGAKIGKNVVIEKAVIGADAVIGVFNDTATTETYTLSLHDALPICHPSRRRSAAANEP